MYLTGLNPSDYCVCMYNAYLWCFIVHADFIKSNYMINNRHVYLHKTHIKQQLCAKYQISYYIKH